MVGVHRRFHLSQPRAVTDLPPFKGTYHPPFFRNFLDGYSLTLLLRLVAAQLGFSWGEEVSVELIG